MIKKLKRKQLIEDVIKEAETFLQMPNPLTVDAAFGKATDIIVVKKYGPGAWGEFKNAAENIYLNRKKKELEDYKHEELLRGAQEAAWARRDEAMMEAEKNNDNLAELKGRARK